MKKLLLYLCCAASAPFIIYAAGEKEETEALRIFKEKDLTTVYYMKLKEALWESLEKLLQISALAKDLLPKIKSDSLKKEIAEADKKVGEQREALRKLQKAMFDIYIEKSNDLNKYDPSTGLLLKE